MMTSMETSVENVQNHTFANDSNDKKTAARGTLIREQLKYCTTLLRQLKKHKEAFPFLQPVDPIALNIPDYLTVIKEPMDLGTVSKKLNDCVYENSEQCIADIRLMLDNCYRYNGPDSQVSLMGKNIEKALETLLLKMPMEHTLPVNDDEKKKIKKRRISGGMYSPETPSSTRRSFSTPSRGTPRRATRRNTKTEHLKFCMNVWKELAKKQNAAFNWPFMEPVDPVALGIPDYFDVIKEPMDLSTIKAKLDSHDYETVDEFAIDVNRMLQNCYLYNPPNSDICAMARKLEDLFNSRLATKPLFVDGDDFASDDSDDELTDDINRLTMELESIQKQLSILIDKKNKKKTAKLQAKRESIRKKNEDELKPMTFEEKQKLSEDINNLDQDKVLTVVEIIHKHMPQLRNNNDQDEIELDIDVLDVRTLRELARFVKECKGEVAPKRQRKASQDKYDSDDDSGSSDESDSEKKNGPLSFGIDTSLTSVNNNNEVAVENNIDTPMEVKVLNEESWNSIEPEQPVVATDEKSSDNTWTEFQSHAQQQKQREESRQLLEEKMKKEKEEKEMQEKLEHERIQEEEERLAQEQKKKEQDELMAKREAAKMELLATIQNPDGTFGDNPLASLAQAADEQAMDTS